jgi:hypothetical protein
VESFFASKLAGNAPAVKYRSSVIPSRQSSLACTNFFP